MIVISDMMGTLTYGSPVLGLVDWVSKRQNKLKAQLYKLSILPSYLLVKRGWINQQSWGQNLLIQSLGLIDHATPEKFDEIADWIVEKNLWTDRRQDVIDRLVSHVQEGHQVYIASSVMEPVVQAFARKFGVHGIGTPLDFQNGKVRFSTELIASNRKIQQVLTQLNVTRVDYAYGDTEQDIPLLEHADHPIAVYPNQALRVEAEKRNWEIFGALK